MNFGLRGLHFPIIQYFLVSPREGIDNHWFGIECSCYLSLLSSKGLGKMRLNDTKRL